MGYDVRGFLAVCRQRRDNGAKVRRVLGVKSDHIHVIRMNTSALCIVQLRRSRLCVHDDVSTISEDHWKVFPEEKHVKLLQQWGEFDVDR